MRLYSNVYNYAIYLKFLWMAQFFFEVQYFKEHLFWNAFFERAIYLEFMVAD